MYIYYPNPTMPTLKSLPKNHNTPTDISNHLKDNQKLHHLKLFQFLLLLLNRNYENYLECNRNHLTMPLTQTIVTKAIQFMSTTTKMKYKEGERTTCGRYKWMDTHVKNCMIKSSLGNITRPTCLSTWQLSLLLEINTDNTSIFIVLSSIYIVVKINKFDEEYAILPTLFGLEGQVRCFNIHFFFFFQNQSTFGVVLCLVR